jgi:hypothetical protein
MRIIFLVFATCVLMACTKKSAWIVEQTDLYSVSGYSDGQSSLTQAPHKPFFLVKKVVGSPDSAVSKNVIQFQIVWCESQSSCNDRDYSLQIIQPSSASEDERVSFESGAKCSIISHSLSDQRITIELSEYTSSKFSPEECEAGVSSPLPTKFIRTSTKTITGKLVKRLGNET